MLELFTIFIPLYQMFRCQTLRTETLKAISDWEAKNKAFGSVDSDSTKVDSPTTLSFTTFVGSEKDDLKHVQSLEKSISSRKTHMYQMRALESALHWNPEPLQKFAALKDFSGENVSFLTHLADWKKSWKASDRNSTIRSLKLPSEQSLATEHQTRERFNRALRLYIAFVSIEHAEFPVNISSKVLKLLEDIFAGPADLLYGDTTSTTCSTITPFADGPAASKVDLETGLQPRTSTSSVSTFDPVSVWYWGEIPEDFNVQVFDDAEQEIKYLVLTNTWPKFVNAGYAERLLDDKGRSLTRRMSQIMFWK